MTGVLAPGKLGKGGRATNSETFRRNPAGIQSRLAEPGQQPGASLAWGGVTLTAKRSGEIKRRAIEPRNLVASSPRLGQPRGPRRASHNWTHRACPVTP